MYKTKNSTIECLPVHLHGWDAQTDSWHGPIPLTLHDPAVRRILARMRTTRGVFHTKVACTVPGLPSIEFFTSAYDLGDTGLAIVHLDGRHANPVGIVAVVPRTRRKLLRDEYAFELMTLLSFLGTPINHGSELEIHDYIEETLRADPSATQVFTVETAEVDSDTGIVLSSHFEQIAAAMLEWLAARELRDEPPPETLAPGAGAVIPGAAQPSGFDPACTAG